MMSPERRAGLEHLIALLEGAEQIVLTTHVNADGDGAGSEAAIAAWLTTRGKRVTIVNPTPFPAIYRHLLFDRDQVGDPGSERAAWAIAGADLFLVVDTGEAGRLGRLYKQIAGRRIAVLDHHPPGDGALDAPGYLDPAACATGELVYDLLTLAIGADEAWPSPAPEAIYTAIISDTGSFRFSNTTPRTHAIAADLLERGVDPESVYRRLYATVPMRRIQLLRAALAELVADPELPVSWITVPRSVVEELSATSEDMDGIVEYARSIEGTEVALLFREVPDGSTKVSFRSNGRVDVNEIAREFGGGGHVKAAGALIGEPLRRARPAVLDAVRRVLTQFEMKREPR